MYRGETTFAGGYKFTYTASDEIVANIWNSDDRNWKVEVYENGNKTGEMTREKKCAEHHAENAEPSAEQNETEFQ